MSQGSADPAPGQGLGPQGFRDFVTELRSEFPDLHIEPGHLLATEDEVALAYGVTGTHSGPLVGHAATGEAVDVRGVQLGLVKRARRIGAASRVGCGADFFAHLRWEVYFAKNSISFAFHS